MCGGGSDVAMETKWHFFFFFFLTIHVNETSVRGHSSASSVHLFDEVCVYHVLYAFSRMRSLMMFILDKPWVLVSVFQMM